MTRKTDPLPVGVREVVPDIWAATSRSRPGVIHLVKVVRWRDCTGYVCDCERFSLAWRICQHIREVRQRVQVSNAVTQGSDTLPRYG